MQEANEEEDSDDEEDFSLFVKKFQKFVKRRKIERCQNFNNILFSNFLHSGIKQLKNLFTRLYKIRAINILPFSCVIPNLYRTALDQDFQ